ncbi:MAG TPA: hypothetical protein ENK97_02220, partial [Campylobacteraceae bacterium]|nr:hypothetical protein [Campylobacteraceae bacterium]
MYLFTSESVSAGHPDKCADTIADTIVDRLLELDSNARVATEVFISGKHIVIGGEVKTDLPLSEAFYRLCALDALSSIGYPEEGFTEEQTLYPDHRSPLLLPLLTLFCLIHAAPAFAAQTITLDNGDRLTGTVERIGDGIVKVKTGYAGTISIEWKKVREIRSDDEPMHVRLTGNGTIPVKSIIRNGDRILLDQQSE